MKKTKLNLERLEKKSMMAAYAYADIELSSLVSKSYSDNKIDRNEAIQIFKSVADNNIVDSNEVNDLKNIVKLNMSDDIKYLSNSMLNSPANKKIPSLNTGASSQNVYNLIDKWFLGKDRPTTPASYIPVNGSLFVNGVNEFDVRQGSLGDCYFLATLSALAAKNKSAILQMFKYNGDFTWTISFNYRTKGVYNKEYVVVDNYLPINSSGYSIYASFGAKYDNNTNELWVSLAEKGYAQWSETGHAELPNDQKENSYTNIGRGGWSSQVLSQLTGVYVFNQFSINTSNTENILKKAISEGRPIVIYRYMNTQKTVGHAYYLKSYSTSTKKYELYNPWGYSHISLTIEELKSQCYGFAIGVKIG